MGMLKKTIAVTVLFMMIISFFPKPYISLADQQPASKGKITEHNPKGRTTVELDSPEKSGSNMKWLWALLGVAAIGGIVAAAGGGGGGGGGDSGETTTGSFEATW